MTMVFATMRARSTRARLNDYLLVIVGIIIYLCVGIVILGILSKLNSSITDYDSLIFLIVSCWPLVILIALAFAPSIKLMSLGKKIAEKIEGEYCHKQHPIK